MGIISYKEIKSHQNIAKDTIKRKPEQENDDTQFFQRDGYNRERYC